MPEDNFTPDEGKEFRVTDDGKLEPVEEDDVEFEEDLTFDD